MLGIEEIADSLGLSVPQVRRRADALSDSLDGHLERGSKNKLLFDSGALEILRKLEDLRKTGKSISEAKKVIEEELHNPTPSKATVKHRETLSYETLAVENEHLKNRIQDYKERIEDLKGQITYLREENQRLLPGQRQSGFWNFLQKLIPTRQID